MKIMHLVLLTYLIIISISDIKYRRISLRLSLIFVGFGIFFAHKSPMALCVGLIPGFILFILSVIFSKHFGSGDATAIIVCGIFLDIAGLLSCLFYALASTFVISVILLLTRRFSRNYELPFIPFIFFGYICTLL